MAATPNSQIGENFANADDVLKNRLDKLVSILALGSEPALRHPAFATDWWNSRNIYDWVRPSVGGGPQIPPTSSEPSSEEETSEEESATSSEESSSEWTSFSISEEGSWDERSK